MTHGDTRASRDWGQSGQSASEHVAPVIILIAEPSLALQYSMAERVKTAGTLTTKSLKRRRTLALPFQPGSFVLVSTR